MAQPSIASYFNTRKRAANADEFTAANKSKRLNEPIVAFTAKSSIIGKQGAQHDDDVATAMRTRSGRNIKRTGAQTPANVLKKMSKKDTANAATPPTLQQQKLVRFVQKGRLSPKKKPNDTNTMTTAITAKSEIAPVITPKKDIQKINEETPCSSNTIISNTLIGKTNNSVNLEQCMKTPTKQIIKGVSPLKHGELKNLVKKELNFDEVKSKISRSAKLQELKASLSRIQELEKTRKAQEEHNRRLREGIATTPKAKNAAAVVQLKEFDTIELEVLVSPSKLFKTPTKLPPATPDKNELMSPRHTNVSKRVLFSPAKDGSPAKLITPPAYQRFMSLVETSKAGDLPLPYKYRHLIELFRAVDSVCSMFYNRKECITFKKLKPAVQRMLRKNFHETHLAQMKQIYPEAFIFTQMKMRNFGSATKSDYFQLVITPNVEQQQQQQQQQHKIDEDNVLNAAQSNAMNPHLMTQRLKHFQQLLLQRVKVEHDKFLKSLNPPIDVPMHKVTRWHPDFDLENCPDIEQAHLPQPPNVEKYSSARDILTTARNLFDCATPMERVMQRYEAKMDDIKNANAVTANDKLTLTNAATCNTPNIDLTATLLKGVPKSLLDKIRAKQAAKALDAMTRRPSQDEEAAKYSRLPDLARHLRNVFITERKSVLTLELIIKKIQNSYRTCLTASEVEEHLKMMAKEVPNWLSFHEVRKTMYLKIVKDMDLSKILQQLELVANEKSKL